MKINLTATVKSDEVQIFADIFPQKAGAKFGLTANPANFSRRRLFTQDKGEPVLIVSVEEARRFAYEILRDTEGETDESR